MKWSKTGSRTAAALLLAAVGFAAGGGAARAETIGPFTSFWALGDSLSDDGNLYAATGGARPAAPYFEGRFSNGPVWAEHVAEDFEAEGRPTGNFAYGGATVASGGEVPNLEGQVEAFAEASRGRLGARPVASVWIGANDLIFGGIPNRTARATGRAAANGVAAGAEALGALGVRDLVLFNLPSLDRTPLYALGGGTADRREARAGSRAFNRTLARRADDLRDKGLNVIEIDAAGLFEELLDDPLRFGVLDARTPCYVEGVAYCGDGAAELLAFFDPVHPNSVVHGALADAVRTEIHPVPLPGAAVLLVTGIAGLGIARSRRTRAHGAAPRAA